MPCQIWAWPRCTQLIVTSTTSPGSVRAAHLLNGFEGHGHKHIAADAVSNTSEVGHQSVCGQHSTRSSEEQYRPGEQKDDVRSGVVGIRVEAHREEEREGDGDAAGSGEPGPQPDNRAQAYGQFRQGDEHPEGCSHMFERADESVDGASPCCRSQLGLDGGRIRCREEPWVCKFLQAHEAERET